MGRAIAPVSLAALAAMCFTSPAFSQEIAAPCQLCGDAKVIAEAESTEPLSIQIATSLVFDRLILSGPGSGTAELRADGSIRTTGTVASVGRRAVVGEVSIQGQPGRYVRVSLPPSVTLFGFSGGTIRVESIDSDLGGMPKLDSQGRLTFRFGGIIRIEGDLDGEFRGDLPIDVEYF